LISRAFSGTSYGGGAGLLPAENRRQSVFFASWTSLARRGVVGVAAGAKPMTTGAGLLALYHHNFYPPVFLAAGGGFVGRYRLGLALRLNGDFACIKFAVFR
jgi:hypothetical protein